MIHLMMVKKWILQVDEQRTQWESITVRAAEILIGLETSKIVAITLEL